MTNFLRLTSIVFAATFVLGSCSTPRGAALQSEVLRESTSEEASFQVVHMSRAVVPQVSNWPVTGWAGGYNWISKSRGPNSNMMRPGDSIALTIWDPQENSLLAPGNQKTTTIKGVVDPSGRLFVPYIGNVVLSGQTPDAAREQIQTALLPVAPSAQVQLTVEAGKRNSVDIVTGVATPGNYKLGDRNTTLLSVIAEGGGISAALRNPLVRLIRDGKTYEIRAEKLFSSDTFNPVLRGGDLIFVEADKRYFTALGASGAEEVVYFDTDEITTLEAMSLIGGLSDTRANPKGVLILRNYMEKSLRGDGSGPTHKDVIFAFDLTSADGLFAARSFKINPRDTIYVTESPVVAAQSVFRLIGTVFGLRNDLAN